MGSIHIAEFNINFSLTLLPPLLLNDVEEVEIEVEADPLNHFPKSSPATMLSMTPTADLLAEHSRGELGLVRVGCVG